MIVDKIQEYINAERIEEAEMNISIYSKMNLFDFTEKEVAFLDAKIKENKETLKKLKK